MTRPVDLSHQVVEGMETYHNTVAVAFQEGSVLGAVFVSVGTGKVDTVYADTFAGAQDQKILKGSNN